MLEAVAATEEPAACHIRFADGTLGRGQMSGAIEPVLPEGARFITEAEYESLRAEQDGLHEARLAELFAAEEQTRREHYEDLRAAGVRESTARALSGHAESAEKG